MPVPLISPAEVRRLCMQEGQRVRDTVARLPDSASKREFMRVSEQMNDFWLTASDDFCCHWIEIAWAEAQIQ